MPDFPLTPDDMRAWLARYADDDTPCSSMFCPLRMAAKRHGKDIDVAETYWENMGSSRRFELPPWAQAFVVRIDTLGELWEELTVADIRRVLDEVAPPEVAHG